MAMNKQNDFKILIIDDNPAIHLDFQKILTTKNQLPQLVN